MLAYAPEAPSFGAISTSARHVCFIQRYRPSRRFGQPSLQHCKSRTWHWQLDAATKELPIFPLNCVAFPACSTPLHIFEARFRVLFNTLLSGESGLEDDLVQEDSPFRGTKQFGMCWVTQRGMAAIGTTLSIQQHARFPDGRMQIDSKGLERFKVKSIKQERPIMICEVEILDEEDDTTTTMATLGDSVRQNFRDFLALNHRLASARRRAEAAAAGRPEPDPNIGPQHPPEEVDSLGPRALSFWISSLFHDSQLRQQSLLEENSTTKRLTTLEDMLISSVAYLRAKLALDGAFSAPSISADAPTAEAAAQGEDTSQQGQAEAFKAEEASGVDESSSTDAQQEGVPDRPDEGSSPAA